MAAPRRRQPSTVSSWPTLSLFAIYSVDPLLDPSERDQRLDDATLEAAKVLLLVTPGEDEPLSKERQGRLMGTVMGLAGLTATFGAQGAPGEMFVQSSKRRMAWFEAEPGFFIHATVALPRSKRHTRRASSATTSSAASAGGTDAPPTGLDNAVLLAGLRQGYREYRLRRGSIVGTLEREGKEALKREIEGFWRGWAETWDVGTGGKAGLEQVLDAVPRCALLTLHTSAQIYPLLAQFAASNPSILPLLLHSSDILSIPTLPPPSTSPEADLDAAPTKTSKKPSPPPLTEEDLLALIRLVSSLSTPAQTTLSVHPDLPSTPFPPAHPLADSSLSPLASPSAESSTSKWTSPFNSLTSGMSSLLAPRPLSGVSLPSLPSMPSFPGLASTAPESAGAGKKDLRAGFRALRAQEATAREERRAEEEAEEAKRKAEAPKRDGGGGGGWTLRNVSWRKLRFGGSGKEGEGAPPAEDGKAPPDVAAVTVDAAAAPPADAAPSTEQAIPPVHDAAVPTDNVLAVPADAAEVSLPTTPAVELAPTVDVGELAEAIGASPTAAEVEEPPLSTVPAGEAAQPAVEAGDEKEGEEEEKADEGEEKTLEMFCGSGLEADTPFSARLYRRGVLTLALALLPFSSSSDETDKTLEWLDTRAERLLEAVETVLEVVVPPKPTYPHRHVVKHGIMTSTYAPVSEGTEAATAEEVEASAALIESYRGVEGSPPILESLTRLSTSQWVVHRRAVDPSVPFSSSTSSSTSPSTATTHPTDVYAVLPAKTTRGKDASLLDAAEELRKVARAYYG
ncbi:hypothetical protein JCM6882_003960 [Rhodosporidiobolus microsporus]